MMSMRRRGFLGSLAALSLAPLGIKRASAADIHCEAGEIVRNRFGWEGEKLPPIKATKPITYKGVEIVWIPNGDRS